MPRKNNPSGLPIGPEHPWLAPLAGYTDLPFRVLCREQGAAVACTEMVSAKGLVYSSKGKSGKKASVPGECLSSTLDAGENSATEELLLTTPLNGFPAGTEADKPLVVQLFGTEPYFLSAAAEIVLERGFTHIDLNMGCSVPKVTRTGAGAAMMQNPDAALAAGKALIKAAGTGRVGFKLRLGWDAGKKNYLELALALEEAGAGWITLHPRYARQGFSGQADWLALAALAERLSIPLIASGDLLNAETARRCLRESGADGLMFARGALRSPAVFREYLDLTGGAASCGTPDYAGTKALILRHVELMRAFSAALPPKTGKRRKNEGPRPDAALMKLRGIIPRYVHDFPGCKALRGRLISCQDWGSFYRLIDDFFA